MMLNIVAAEAKIHSGFSGSILVCADGYNPAHVFSDIVQQVEYKDIVKTIDHDEFLNAFGVEKVKEWLAAQ